MERDSLYQLGIAWLLAAIGFYLYAIGHATDSFSRGRTGAVAFELLEPVSHLLFVVTVFVLVALPVYAVVLNTSSSTTASRTEG